MVDERVRRKYRLLHKYKYLQYRVNANVDEDVASCWRLTIRVSGLGWLRGTVVERRSLAGELSLSCARPVAGGWPFVWVHRPLYVNHQLAFHPFGVDKWAVSCNCCICYDSYGVAPSGERLRRKGRHGVICRQNCVIYVRALWDYACLVNGAIYILFHSFPYYLMNEI